MNNNQLEFLPLAMLHPFGQNNSLQNITFAGFNNPTDNSIGILQEILKLQALSYAKNATIDQVTRVEDYLVKNLIPFNG